MLGNAAHQHDVGHRLEDTEAVDPARNPDRQAFAGELIDQRQQPELAAILCLGFDEVVAPHVIAAFRSQPDARTVVEPKTASRLVFLGNLQPLAAPDALHAVRANIPSGIVEQRRDPAIAIAAIFGGKRYDRSGQRIFARADNRRVTLRTTWLVDEPAGVTFREPVLLSSPFDRLPTSFGAYKFPEAISFKTCFSSERSATSRLSRMFSFSRSFIRFACSS